MNASNRRNIAQITGIICIILGIICNRFVLESIFAGDGQISSLAVNIGIIIVQIFLVGAGILYIKQAYHILSQIGIAFLLLFALQFWVRVLLEVPFPEKRMFQALPKPPSFFDAGLQYRDQISLYEDRFTEVKDMLPAGGVVGYIASGIFSKEESKFYLELTRYTLSPLKLERRTQQEFIVGNFLDFDQKDFTMPDIEGATLAKDFGNGVVLFERRAIQ